MYVYNICNIQTYLQIVCVTVILKKLLNQYFLTLSNYYKLIFDEYFTLNFNIEDICLKKSVDLTYLAYTFT